METKEAILATISELNADLKEKIEADSIKQTQALDSTQINKKSEESKNIFIDIKEESNDNDINIDDEIAFLFRLKEKALVLFEGLKSNKNNNLEIKSNMIINYFEYQLYLIEDRLKTINENIQKEK